MDGTPQKGRANSVFLDTADDTATPTWVEFDLVDDASYSITPALEDVTNRSHGRANRQASFGYDSEISFSFKAPGPDPTTSALYLKMRNAALSGAAIQVKLTDNVSGGGEQLILWVEISGWEKSEPIGGHSVWSVTMVPTSGNDGTSDHAAPAFSANS